MCEPEIWDVEPLTLPQEVLWVRLHALRPTWDLRLNVTSEGQSNGKAS